MNQVSKGKIVACIKMVIRFSFFLLFFIEGGGQDVHFSQFFEAPLWRNPSLAGLFNGDVRFQGVYRTQWGAVTVPYQTGSFNGEYKMPIGAADRKSVV